jgi:phosphoribosyl 1,2-cyclic phosphodiesterase
MPCPGPETVLFGGNTSCLEVRLDDRLVIIDAGSGIRSLGDWLVRNELKKGPIVADLFFSHTHWDHLMGFPAFTPIYVPGTLLKIRGPVAFEEDTLDGIIGTQLSYKYWPVRVDELGARIDYEQLRETRLDLGRGLIVKTKFLNHPILCLGYRFEYEGKSFCTVYDHEPFRNVFPEDPDDPNYDEDAAKEGAQVAKEENDRVLEFIAGADLLIHDAQYTAKEYMASKIGWGHSSIESAINNAYRAKAKKLLLFHHDPNRTDTELQELELFYQAKVSGRSELRVEVAREGTTYTL